MTTPSDLLLPVSLLVLGSCASGFVVLLGTTGCVHGGDGDAIVDAAAASNDDASNATDDDASFVLDDAGSTNPDVDGDGDGVPASADCDDADPTRYPGAIEDCLTAVDEDCDGEGATLDLDCDGDVDEDTDEDSDEGSDEGHDGDDD